MELPKKDHVILAQVIGDLVQCFHRTILTPDPDRVIQVDERGNACHGYLDLRGGLRGITCLHTCTGRQAGGQCCQGNKLQFVHI